MKRIFIFVAVFTFCSTPSFSQSQLGKTIKKYYRVNPFEGSFPAFIKALSTDPKLINKTVVSKSDTSNYFLKGDYKIFNPFSTNAEKVEMIFAEHEEALVVKNISTPYTIYTYQILAYFDDTEQNRKAILKDYNKIKKDLKREMPSEIGSLKGFKNIEDGEIANYYYNNTFIAPLTLSWQTLSKSKKLALTIIAKLSVQKNYAVPAGTYITFEFDANASESIFSRIED